MPMPTFFFSVTTRMPTSLKSFRNSIAMCTKKTNGLEHVVITPSHIIRNDAVMYHALIFPKTLGTQHIFKKNPHPTNTNANVFLGDHKVALQHV